MKTHTKAVDPELIWLTPEEAAAKLRISRSILYRLLSSGELESFLVPGTSSRRIDAQPLRDYAARVAGSAKRAA